MIRPENLCSAWTQKELGDVVEFLDHLRRPVTAKERKPGPYPYYGATGQLDSVADYIFNEPLILLAEDGGPFGDPNQKIAYCVKGKCWVNNHAHVLRPKDNVDIQFLCRLLEKYDVTRFINGATRKKLNKSNASKIPITIPPLEEQKRIAAILDKADGIRHKRQQTIKLAGALLRATFLDMFGDPAVNSKGWLTYAMDELVKINPRITKEEKTDLNKRVSFVPMSSVNDLLGEIITAETRILADVEKGFTFFKKGDVLFAKITPCMENGKSAIAKNLCNGIGFGSTEFHVLRPLKNITKEYLFSFIHRAPFRKAAKDRFTGSAGQRRVPTDFLRETKIPLPPYELQLQFSDIFNKIRNIRHKRMGDIINSENLFNSLTQLAFRGEL